MDENTIVTINRDRASWIRQGVAYFPNAMYQVDRYHLIADVRNLFGAKSKNLKKIIAVLYPVNDEQTEVTGATLLATLANG